ncbi:MAG: dihydrofolate reductase family protein [Gammaproteobacteria bacterium]|nr:dihydrofolate reductase family protein [Gammaproteobacteria bacterium]
MPNSVFIAASLDGYIADKEAKLDWLQVIPNRDNCDGGFHRFMDRIDAIVMGRNTFQTVDGFECEWPYTKPVFVLSNSMSTLPTGYENKVQLIQGPLPDVIHTLHNKGYQNLYIDGGTTIQNFLKEDLIDEMIITLIPILLGGGVPLFGELSQPLLFEFVKSEVFLNAWVQNHFRRKKD